MSLQSYTVKPDFGPELLHELFTYDETSGNMIRNTTRGGQRVGTIAGYIRADGYRYIRVNNKQYLGHLLTWYYIHWEWPTYQIDHINSNKADNRIENLRDVVQQINQQNMIKAPVTNKSCGLLGVSRNLSSSKHPWKARITLSDGTRKIIGYFKTAEEAHEAYIIEKRKVHAGCTI